jgi:hypothetical protein
LVILLFSRVTSVITILAKRLQEPSLSKNYGVGLGSGSGWFRREELMSRKIDCITYLNGPDILKLRLAELAPYIDLFVIVESTHDFAGNPKPIRLKDNPITGYPIRHVVIEPRWPDLARKSNRQELAWNNVNGIVEEGFREGTKDADSTDLLYCSDFDEIPRPSKLLEGPLEFPVLFSTDLYVYWLNYKTGKFGPTVSRTQFGDTTSPGYSFWSALMFRYAATEKYIIQNGGWHFTSFGGVDMVMEKFAGYPDNPNLWGLSRQTVEDKIMNGIDFSDQGSGDKFVTAGPLASDLPETILKAPKDWLSLVHPDWRDKT